MSGGETPPSGKGFWSSLPGVLTGIAAVVTAVVGVVGLVIARGDGGSPPVPPQSPVVVTVTVTPSVAADVTLESDPLEVAPSPVAQAPANQCPFHANGFWMPLPSTPYGPFGAGYFLSWDAFGFYVWDPGQFVWLQYPDPGTRNSWVNLTGTPFSGCVAGVGSPVFGEFVG
jgi:hypothetical protein